ncbi:MAG TPA: OmpH family outer membrane protein [Gammaproteobacteria bacterium]|nr:OmpH family outer membrane protein [Gammaproteobacteria bacterium]
MQRYKVLTALVAAATLLFASSAAFAATPKIGVIDVNYIISHSKRGQAASDALEALYKKKKETLDKEKASLAATRQDLQAAKDKKSEEFKKKVASFQQAAGAFQQHVQTGQNEVEQRRTDLFKPILEDMKKVLDDYAKDHDYTLILNKTTDAVAFATDSYNLNDEIVAALNKYEGE